MLVTTSSRLPQDLDPRSRTAAGGSSTPLLRPDATRRLAGAARRMLLPLLLALTCCAGTESGLAQASVNLTWDASPGSAVEGYYVYFGQASRLYTGTMFVVNSTSATVSGLQPGETYYFAVTAIDLFGRESDFSNEITYSTPASSGGKLVVSPIPDQTANAGSWMVSVPFTVSDGLNLLTDLSVSVSSSNPSLVPASNVVISLSGTTHYANILLAAGKTGSARITLTLSYGWLSTATSFTLTVEGLPTIELTSPSDGSAYTAPASIELAASVNANGHSIQKVQFYNGLTLLGEDTTAPYTFTWNRVGSRDYRLSASAVYDGGSVVPSQPKSVTVVNPPPVVTLSSPTDGTTYSAPASVNLLATVDANGHSIDKVRFYDGQALLSEVTAPPYSWTWLVAAAGSHQLKATALYDGAGSVDSASAIINVVSLPLPWQTKDIGQVGLAGSASVVGADYVISGAGAMGVTADSFRYVYQPLNGDGWLIARVTSIKSSNNSGIVGIMARETLRSDSRYVMIALSPDGTLRTQSRNSTGGPAASNSLGAAALPNVTLYLSRTGNSFFLYSYDGSSWKWANLSGPSMASNIYIGLAAASGSGAALMTCDLDSVAAYP